MPEASRLIHRLLRPLHSPNTAQPFWGVEGGLKGLCMSNVGAIAFFHPSAPPVLGEGTEG